MAQSNLSDTGSSILTGSSVAFASSSAVGRCLFRRARSSGVAPSLFRALTGAPNTTANRRWSGGGQKGKLSKCTDVGFAPVNELKRSSLLVATVGESTPS